MDISTSLILIVILLPLILILIFSIILFSGSNPCYSRVRIGKNGNKFTLYKFTTMKSDPEILIDYFKNNPDQEKYFNENQKLLYDPRITKVGFLLREISIDELPQLINILIGDMSFIGPRPIVEEEIIKYGNSYELYKQVRPGLSGLWQVSGRNDTSYKQRVEFDVLYIENQSFLLDVKIFFKTFFAVLSRKGAY